MSTDKKSDYMTKFSTFSSQKKRRHLTIALAYLLRLLSDREQMEFVPRRRHRRLLE